MEFETPLKSGDIGNRAMPGARASMSDRLKMILFENGPDGICKVSAVFFGLIPSHFPFPPRHFIKFVITTKKKSSSSSSSSSCFFMKKEEEQGGGGGETEQGRYRRGRDRRYITSKALQNSCLKKQAFLWEKHDFFVKKSPLYTSFSSLLHSRRKKKRMKCKE